MNGDTYVGECNSRCMPHGKGTMRFAPKPNTEFYSVSLPVIGTMAKLTDMAYVATQTRIIIVVIGKMGNVTQMALCTFI